MLGQRNMLTERLPLILAVVTGFNAVLAPLAVLAVRWAWDLSGRSSAGVGYGS
jgi:hypothetical protein